MSQITQRRANFTPERWIYNSFWRLCGGFGCRNGRHRRFVAIPYNVFAIMQPNVAKIGSVGYFKPRWMASTFRLHLNRNGFLRCGLISQIGSFYLIYYEWPLFRIFTHAFSWHTTLFGHFCFINHDRIFGSTAISGYYFKRAIILLNRYLMRNTTNGVFANNLVTAFVYNAFRLIGLSVIFTFYVYHSLREQRP